VVLVVLTTIDPPQCRHVRVSSIGTSPLSWKEKESGVAGR